LLLVFGTVYVALANRLVSGNATAH
jgi:hypothetical protein